MVTIDKNVLFHCSQHSSMLFVKGTSNFASDKALRNAEKSVLLQSKTTRRTGFAFVNFVRMLNFIMW